MERWRAVVGFEGWYEVSDRGRVRRVRAAPRTRPGFVLKGVPQKHEGLYLWVCLRKDGKNWPRAIHVLVLEAFVGPRPEGQQARHLNGIARANHLGNLRWGTPMENSADQRRHGTQARGESNGVAILTEALVRKIRASSESYNVLAKRFGISRYTVRDVKKRWSWVHVR